MSFANLIRSAPKEGRIKIVGGQTQGNVEKTKEKITIDKYRPSVGKGSEYAAKFRAEEDKAIMEGQASTSLNVDRHDVTSTTGGENLSNMFEVDDLTSIGTLPNFRELQREELTQVYNSYSFEPVEPSEHLEPIHNEREQILRHIEGNQVSVIKGPTGCGKSTQIPQFILDSYAKRRAHCNIVVTQPRRIAAITIAQRVCEERDWKLGGIVGYQVGLDKQAQEDTRLLYCTTGVLLEKLISVKHIQDYTHIFLDEVHEREEDMDFAMLVIKKFLRTNSFNTKVILMSATMDVTRFAKYYGVVLQNKKHFAPSYEIKRASKFNVQVHYLDALGSLGDLPVIKGDEPCITKEAYRLVPLMLQAFNTIDAEDYKAKRSPDAKGAVLIFLPGLHQIETLYDLLETEDEKSQGVLNLWLCPLHSSITKQEQEMVRKFAPDNKRKIILSTNIAESSITITDVKYVIDFCLTKHLVADSVTGFSSLQMAWASHTNCLQREGRVGRVQDGRVYRIVPKSFYLSNMPKESIPEMQRCPLDIVVLKCKKLMESECPLRLISNALDPPNLDNYESTILKLKEIGALLITCDGRPSTEDGDLTFIGRVMAGMPLDIHVTKLILLGHLFDVLEEAIIMGCAMSVRNIFSEPFRSRLEAYNNKLLWADSSESDLIAYFNAYTVWRQQTGLGKFNRAVKSEEQWAKRYMLQIKHLQEVAKLEVEIKRRLQFFNIHVVRQRNKPIWCRQEKPLILKLVLSGAFYPHYYSRRAQSSNAESEAVKMLSGHSPYNSVYVQNMPHPAPLYYDQLSKALKEYGVSERVKFYHDDSRKMVIIFDQAKTFREQKVGDREFNLSIPGEIVMPVYRAIKLRQLNLPLTIHTMTAKLAKEELEKFTLDLNSSDDKVDPQLKPKILQAQLGIFEVLVTHMENASHFWGQMTDKEKELLFINEMLDKVDALEPICGEIEDDFIYAAPYRESDNQPAVYYRAKVKAKQCVQGQWWVDVFFIDYGNTSRMLAHDLRQLVEKEHQLEIDEILPLALECVLAEVAPSVWTTREGQWSKEANKYVTNMILERKWYIEIYSYVNDIASVLLYLRDNIAPSNTDPLTLNKELIRREFARFREESYFSKLDHARRLKLEKVGVFPCKNEDDPNKALRKTILSLPTKSERPIVMLKGPNTPLEMKLFSMSRCTSQREVKVEWNSVNSVLLDSDPTDPHDRLLVAGLVSQSPDGRKLTLNHTTVLPNMPGLSALICLIFAPIVELRTDDNYSRYTGALCGLGLGEKDQPLFRENDIEIDFDVEITEQDLLTVNKLRYWMNERYCSDDAEDTSDAQMINIQKNIRTFTIQLLKMDRKSVKVYRNSDQFMWGKIPQDRLLHPFKDTKCDMSRFIYRLHMAVEINQENDREEIENLLMKLKSLNISLTSGLTPKDLCCYLCDEYFQYLPQLKLHFSSNYHKQLTDWLERRHSALTAPTT